MTCLLYAVAFAFLSCALPGSLGGGTSEDEQQLRCLEYSPVVGLQSSFDGQSRNLSTICRPPDPSSPFSPASPSSTYTIPGLTGLISGCLNQTVVSGLLWSAERGTAGSGGEGGEGEIEVASCSHPPAGHSLDHCSWSRWLNRPQESFSVNPLPRPWILRSVRSHSVKRSHRYKLELCHLTGPSPSPSPDTCHLPHIQNGTLRGISHTYSITQSHAPFRIKMQLVCDEGYLPRKRKAMAVCENGAWTQLPLCQKCDGVCNYDAAPVITIGQLMVGFVAGGNVTLDCEVKGQPMPSLSWHRVLLNGVRVPLLDHTHFVTHENGSLTIISTSDVDSGPYVCWAWNAVGSDIAYIHVYNSHPDGTGSPAIYHWSPLHVVSDHTLTPSHLHCHAHGYPPPTISWSSLPLTHSPLQTFHPLTSPTVSQLRNGTLKFKPIQTADTALYRCQATNLFGTVSMETILYVDSAPEEAGPVSISADWVSSYTTSPGARLEMSCPASSAHTSPHFLWMRKGGRVSMSGSRVWRNGNGTLVFGEVLAEDEGPYWCVVWDDRGVAMEMTLLIINNSTQEPHPPPVVAGEASLHLFSLSLILTSLAIWTLS